MQSSRCMQQIRPVIIIYIVLYSYLDYKTDFTTSRYNLFASLYLLIYQIFKRHTYWTCLKYSKAVLAGFNGSISP